MHREGVLGISPSNNPSINPYLYFRRATQTNG